MTPRRWAGWLADRAAVPTTVSAVLGYYAHSGVFDLGSLRLQRRVDRQADAMIAEAFAEVETRLASEFDHPSVDFAYDTKLILPAKLTLGYCYRTLSSDADVERAEELTRLAVVALIDGDMRDARNDAEYGDFEVDFPTDTADKERIAAVAQETLQERVEAGFDRFSPAVADLYDWAVDISEGHQAADDHFRDLMAAAADDGAAARERIRTEYKYADFDDPPAVFDSSERSLPYLKTQYERVGVIYDGMCRMYRAAGIGIEPAFGRSIVLAIIGAQIWLDDVDDYAADRREGQLTPVTAEYLLANSEAEAYNEIVALGERYLDLARDHATAADSPLTGIATEYIYRSGTPAVLPGSEA